MTSALSTEQILWLVKNQPWKPQVGPQSQAFNTEADICLYGGAAGGGKTSLAVGLSLTKHTETLIIRREATQLGGVLDEVARLVDPERKGYSGQTREWKIPAWDGTSRKIQFGSIPNLGDEQRYQGRPHDLLVVDEAANLLEQSVRFVMGWVRTTKKGQRTRTLLCSNPPTSSEGQWLVEMFAPWLDTNHHNPATPGELRWYTTIGGKDVEVDTGDEFIHQGEAVKPKSRTFIPAKVQDNKYLMDTDYMSQLQALPEPLRSQMLYGDFSAGREDGQWQVIPSAWIDEAMARWEPKTFDPTKIVSAGLDPSRGGRDATVLSCREDWHYHELQAWEGHTMPTGGDVAGKVVELLGMSNCPVHVDVIGIGASVVDILTMYIHTRVVPVNVAEKAKGDKDWSGTLTFANRRAQLWWRFRDVLNPANGHDVALPRDQRLKAELCAPTYSLGATGIKVEGKPEIIKRLGRSTDRADAVIMAAERTPVLSMSGISNRIRVNL